MYRSLKPTVGNPVRYHDEDGNLLAAIVTHVAWKGPIGKPPDHQSPAGWCVDLWVFGRTSLKCVHAVPHRESEDDRKDRWSFVPIEVVNV